METATIETKPDKTKANGTKPAKVKADDVTRVNFEFPPDEWMQMISNHIKDKYGMTVVVVEASFTKGNLSVGSEAVRK